MPQYTDRFGRFITEDDAHENGVIKHGCSIRIPMLLADSGPSRSIQDTERTFADSAEGQRAIAYARQKHDLFESRFGENAKPWTAELEREAIRDAVAELAEQSAIANRNPGRADPQGYRDGARDVWIASLSECGR